jgi:low molecular weight protein-tyrosine phosphatase
MSGISWTVPEASAISRRMIHWIRTGMAGMFWRCLGMAIGNPPIPHSSASVLFICQGNVCRSPFAERYFRKIAGDGNLRGIRSSSAGLDVRVSAPPPDLAVQVAKTLGVELMDHRSKPVTADMIENTDMIFTMEHCQAAFIRKTYPDHVQKIFLLPMFDTGPLPAWDYSLRYNIPDPYGKSEKDFLECFRKIESSIDGFLS